MNMTTVTGHHDFWDNVEKQFRADNIQPVESLGGGTIRDWTNGAIFKELVSVVINTFGSVD